MVWDVIWLRNMAPGSNNACSLLLFSFWFWLSLIEMSPWSAQLNEGPFFCEEYRRGLGAEGLSPGFQSWWWQSAGNRARAATGYQLEELELPASSSTRLLSSPPALVHRHLHPEMAPWILIAFIVWLKSVMFLSFGEAYCTTPCKPCFRISLIVSVTWAYSKT